ncbi:MAG: SH3 domain-containing protein [Nitrospirae bacterium]|nr:SH3 domain-containing protein [Nitrospirota bacterium]
MKNFTRILLAGLALCLLPHAGMASDAGSALKADDIKAEPYRDAKTVGSLKAGDKVSIEKREGGWFKISSPKKGWVRMLSIRKGSAPAGVKASSVTALASGRAGTGTVVSSSGVRGLNEEELKKADFDGAELKKAESYAASKKDAEGFAGKARLKARKVDYLPE